MKTSYKLYFAVIFSLFLSTHILSASDDIVISGTVLGAPVKPIVTGESVCSANNFYINLDWPTDLNTETYDIKRNGSLLATNILNSDYKDSDISNNSSYNYQVIAHGPMGPGSAASDEITVTTSSECPIPQPPFQHKIETLENTPLSSYDNNPVIEERRPFFSGKTNIPNAKIEIILDGTPKIYQTIFANSNGFWTWQSPEILDRGIHTLYVTATDIYDPLITASDTLQFTVAKIDTDDTTNDHPHKPKKNTPANAFSSYIPDEVELLERSSQNPPFQTTVIVENFNHYVYLGEKLSLSIEFSKKTPSLENKDYQVFYEIVNKKGDIIYVDSEYINIYEKNRISKKIPLSILAPLGDYRIRVKAYDGKTLIAGENYFSIKELPIINIGFCQLSLTQIINSFAWLLIIILLAFFFLLASERHHSQEGIYQMTENYLEKSGFFSRKND